MSQPITASMICKEALRLAALARHGHVPICKRNDSRHKLQEFYGQHVVMWFPNSGWQERPLDCLVNGDGLQTAVLLVCQQMPLPLPPPRKKLELPGGVEDSAIEHYEGMQCRAIVDWVALDSSLPPCSYHELRNCYNIAVDLNERRACGQIIRLDFTLDIS